MEHPIKDFPAYALVKAPDEPEGWIIRNVAKGFDLEGSARPGRRRRFKLRNGDVRLNKTLEGWLAHAGLLVRTDRDALPLPDFPNYELARRADGTWGVRSAGDSIRWRGHWLAESHGQVSLVAGGHQTVRQFTHLVLAAHGRPRPSARHVVVVDASVNPREWPRGLSWRAPVGAEPRGA